MSASNVNALPRTESPGVVPPRHRVFAWLPYLLVVVLIAALITSLAMFSALQEKQHHRDRAIEATRNIAQLLDQIISCDINMIDVVLRTVAEHYREQSELGLLDPVKVNAYLEKRKALIPGVLSLHLVDKSGFVRYGLANLATNPVSISDRDFFIRLRDNPEAGLVITGPVQDRISKQWAIGLARRTSAPDDSFAGIAYAYLSTEYFHQILSSLKLGGDGAATIRMADLALVHRFPDTKGAVGSRHVSDQLRNIMDTDSIQGNYIATTALDEKERSNAYRKIHDYPLYVIVGLATDDYLGDWRRNIWILSGLGALAILLTSITALLLCQNVQRQEAEIEARKAIESGLHEAQRDLLAVQRLAHAGSWSWDIQSNRQEWSEEIYAIYNRSPGLGPASYPEEVRSYFNPQSWELLSAAVEKCLADGTSYECDAEVVRPDGTRRWIVAFGETVKDNTGSIVQLRGTVQDITERKIIECERNDSYQKLAQLSRHLVALQEDARRRLAADLHDRTSPNLAAIGINMDVAAMAIQEGNLAELATRLEDNRALLDDTAASIRDICADLRPPALDYAGIIPAMEAYISQFSRRTGLAVQFDGTDGITRKPPDLESVLFRLFQEALTNIAKHAKAESVVVELRLDTLPIALTIIDDGQGFDPESMKVDSGLGIINMREMSEFSGGIFKIQSSPGKGTRIHIEIDAL